MIKMGGSEGIPAQRWLAGLRKTLLTLTLLSLVTVSNEFVAVAQKEESLLEQIAERVSVNEPAFKLVFKRKPTAEDISNSLGWKLDDDFVSVTFYELASAESAAKNLQLTLNAPVSVISETLKLERLADEAYLKGHGAYSKPGSTGLFLRRGHIQVTISASSPDLARRFAAHIVSEVDRRSTPKSQSNAHKRVRTNFTIC